MSEQLVMDLWEDEAETIAHRNGIAVETARLLVMFMGGRR